MSTFEDRASAEAERRHPAFQSITGRDIWPNSRFAFEAGAKWAKEQDPTDAEVLAAAIALASRHSLGWSHLSKSEQGWDLGDARAALLAAKAAE